MTEPLDRTGLALRAGDHVLVKFGENDETLVVAAVGLDGDGDWMVAWAGWPPGEILASACDRVYACTDEEHAKMARALRERPGPYSLDGYYNPRSVYGPAHTCSVCATREIP